MPVAQTSLQKQGRPALSNDNSTEHTPSFKSQLNIIKPKALFPSGTVEQVIFFEDFEQGDNGWSFLNGQGLWESC